MQGEGFHHDIAYLAEARCGRWLDERWLLSRVLGLGGTSAVYEATHRNGRRAAIKVLHPQWAMMPTVRRRFLREGYISNRVEHPSVVAVLDDGETSEGEAYLVLELLAGESLAQRLAQAGTLPLDQAIDITTSVLAVLEAAHTRGIIHRDIKPDNLMLLPDGTVKVLDFGIASIKNGDASATLATQPGGARGTPTYMAPEQARGLTVDGRTDLWALGAVLYRMLSGHPVRKAASADATLVAAATEPIAPLQRVMPDVSPRLAAVIDRALTFDPAGRFADAASMRAALLAALAPGAAPTELSTLPEGAAVVLPPDAPSLRDGPSVELPDPSARTSLPVEPDAEVGLSAAPEPTPGRPRWPWLLVPAVAVVSLLAARPRGSSLAAPPDGQPALSVSSAGMAVTSAPVVPTPPLPEPVSSTEALPADAPATSSRPFVRGALPRPSSRPTPVLAASTSLPIASATPAVPSPPDSKPPDPFDRRH